MKIESQKSLAIKFLIFGDIAYFVAPANQKHTFCIFKIIENEQKSSKKQPKQRFANLLLLFIDFYQFWLDFGAPRGGQKSPKSEKSLQKGIPKKRPKKIECSGHLAQGSTEMGGAIKLRFRADQRDFADFLHAFLCWSISARENAKSMQSHAIRINACDKCRPDRYKKDRRSLQNEIWYSRRRQGAADLATPFFADPLESLDSEDSSE